MKDIIYLKSEQFGDCLMALDPNKLKSIEVYRQEDCTIKKYDAIEDLEDYIQICIANHGFKITSRQEFNDAFIGFSKMLNKISKEL